MYYPLVLHSFPLLTENMSLLDQFGIFSSENNKDGYTLPPNSPIAPRVEHPVVARFQPFVSENMPARETNNNQTIYFWTKANTDSSYFAQNERTERRTVGCCAYSARGSVLYSVVRPGARSCARRFVVGPNTPARFTPHCTWRLGP